MANRIPLLGPKDDPKLEKATEASDFFKRLFLEYPVGDCHFVYNYEKMDTVLGKGSSGTVFKAKHSENAGEVAIKRLSDQANPDDVLHRNTIREITILRNLNHENIIRFEEVVVGKKKESLYIVSELADEDLGQVLEKIKFPLAQDEIKNLMKQLFTGLAYIHSNDIIHRDINPSNLLLNQSGVLKICDFGQARFTGDSNITMSENSDPTMSENSDSTMSENSGSMTPNIGTMWYTAPEIVFGYTNYTNAVDLWSAACVFAEMLENAPLFPAEDYMTLTSKFIDLLGTPNDSVMPGFSKSYVAKTYDLKPQPFNNVKIRFKDFSDGTQCLLKILLRYDSGHRPSAEACLGAPYFTEEPLAVPTSGLFMSIGAKKVGL